MRRHPLFDLMAIALILYGVIVIVLGIRGMHI